MSLDHGVTKVSIFKIFLPKFTIFITESSLFCNSFLEPAPQINCLTYLFFLALLKRSSTVTFSKIKYLCRQFHNNQIKAVTQSFAFCVTVFTIKTILIQFWSKKYFCWVILTQLWFQKRVIVLREVSICQLFKINA